MDAIRYDGTPNCPSPPLEPGWEMLEASDDFARLRAEAMLEGDLLPVWHFCDEFLTSGLYRFYRFENACGQSIAAYRYCGQIGALGEYVVGHEPGAMGLEPGACPEGYIQINGVCVPPDAPNPKNWQAPVAPPPDRPAGEEGGENGAITDTPRDAPRAANGAPLWQPDETCDAWVPDATNRKATELANEILWTPGSPSWPTGKRGTGQVPPWVDGTTYHTIIDGVPWKFPMYSVGGIQYVSALRCSKPKAKPKPPAAMVSSGALWIVLALLALVGVGSAIALSKKPTKHGTTPASAGPLMAFAPRKRRVKYGWTSGGKRRQRPRLRAA